MKSESYAPFSAYTPAPSTKPVEFFCTLTPSARTSGGQPAERLRHAVLHVDGGDVRVARHVERHRDLRRRREFVLDEVM